MENVDKVFLEDVDKIFWDKTTHARDFIDDIAEKLDYNKNIILNSSDEIPWYVSFRNAIENEMNERIGEKYELIRIEESKEKFLFENENNIKITILDNRKIFDERTSCEYMEKDNFAGFFAKNAFTHNKNNKNFYVWLELYSEKSFDNWVNFVSDYIRVKDKNNKNIVFIISYNSNYNINDKIKAQFEYFSLRDYLTWYDCYVFFTIISNLSNIKISEYFKLYLAELLTNIIRDNITGKNIQLCIECLKDYNNLLNEPIKTIKNIFSESQIEEKDIIEILYRSQIRVIYPILNEFRLYFIKKYKDKLNNIIKNHNKWLDDICKKKEGAETPKEAEDFEFGLLKQCGGFIPPKIKYENDDMDALFRFSEARNKLSHIGFINYNLDMKDPKIVDLLNLVEIDSSKLVELSKLVDLNYIIDIYKIFNNREPKLVDLKYIVESFRNSKGLNIKKRKNKHKERR